MTSILLRALLCLTLVLNGIGSVAAGVRVLDAEQPDAKTEVAAYVGMTDCGHPLPPEAGDHAGMGAQLPIAGAAHDADECLELCLEQCLTHGPGLLSRHNGLHSLEPGLVLAPGNDLPEPSTSPALLMRPPIA